MNEKAKATAEAMAYLLKKGEEIDVVKMTQLMYLADKYSLTHYGKTITGDVYYATNCCVVGKTAVNLLKSFKK
jgi:hypothetical protein